MLNPLRLIEAVLLFSDDVDSPLCIKCGGIAFTESKTFYRTSVTVPQQPLVLTAAACFPLVNFQLFVLVLLSAASPIELQ